MQGDLNDESEVLEWLIVERTGADDVVRYIIVVLLNING